MPAPDPAPPPLCREVIELLSSGVVMSVGTRDAALAPECAPVMGSRVQRDRRGLTVFVPKAVADATLANLRDNGQIAVNIVRPSDDKSVQVKGHARAVRDATDSDRVLQEQQRSGLVEQLAFVGLPRVIARRMAWWPSVAIDIDVDDVFVATPGPGAGERLSR
ncbi:MAG TPA: pyridoxamine 5'-phosphate oxidase family protein [Polyangia bacterium]